MPGTEWSEPARDKVLTVLALNAGSVPRTLEQLEQDGIPAPAERTLRTWKETDRYREVREQMEKVRDEEHAESMSDLLAERLDLLRMAHGRIREKLDKDEIPARDLANLDRNLATSAGILNANSRINREKPLGITEQRHRTSEDAWAALSRAFPGLVIDGTAEDDDPPAQLPSGDNTP